MKTIKLIAIILTSMSFAITTQAQLTYTSADNNTGEWLDDGIWTKSDAWANNAPGNPVNGATAEVHIYGKVTFKDNGSDLSINGSADLYVHDTLIIETGLDGGGGGSINVLPGGVLIVLKASKMVGSFELDNNGNVVLVDDLNMKGGSLLDNHSGFFTYTSISKTGGSKILGLSPPFNNADSLYTNNPALYGLVSNSISTALPITLLYIESKCGQDDKVLVEWATSTEQDNDFFTLWRSTDGMKWDSIASVKGAGNSREVKEYSFKDEKPTEHDTYYKISQTDFDGQNEEFDIMSIYCLYNHKHITMSPNPAIDFFNFDFYNEHHTEDNLIIRVFNQYGHLMTVVSTESDSDDNSHRVNLPSHMNDGTYYVQVTLGGAQFYSGTIIKQER